MQTDNHKTQGVAPVGSSAVLGHTSTKQRGSIALKITKRLQLLRFFFLLRDDPASYRLIYRNLVLKRRIRRLMLELYLLKAKVLSLECRRAWINCCRFLAWCFHWIFTGGIVDYNFEPLVWPNDQAQAQPPTATPGQKGDNQ